MSIYIIRNVVHRWCLAFLVSRFRVLLCGVTATSWTSGRRIISPTYFWIAVMHGTVCGIVILMGNIQASVSTICEHRIKG
jgi:hypothetical protein